jgi:hypothetical protein
VATLRVIVATVLHDVTSVVNGDLIRFIVIAVFLGTLGWQVDWGYCINGSHLVCLHEGLLELEHYFAALGEAILSRLMTWFWAGPESGVSYNSAAHDCTLILHAQVTGAILVLAHDEGLFAVMDGAAGVSKRHIICDNQTVHRSDVARFVLEVTHAAIVGVVPLWLASACHCNVHRMHSVMPPLNSRESACVFREVL